MENLNKLWRFFFAISFIAIALQQLIYADFRPVILPPSYPAWLLHRLVWTWVFSVLLIAACVAIIFEIKARSVSIILGSVLLLFVLVFHIPYQVSLSPLNLGAWSNTFKVLTLSGGAFIVAGSLPQEINTSVPIKLLENLIPLGKYFLAIMLVGFGIDHFIYIDFVATFVPNWIPGHAFWAYFAGVALILSGIGIVLNIQLRLAATLLGVMLFLWLIMLHLPRAITNPYSDNGNEWTSVFEALGFSGIAFILAGRQPDKKVEYYLPVQEMYD
jgi:uncharacterized membrane protein YphA (DoxX/SURF4 family)